MTLAHTLILIGGVVQAVAATVAIVAVFRLLIGGGRAAAHKIKELLARPAPVTRPLTASMTAHGELKISGSASLTGDALWRAMEDLVAQKVESLRTDINRSLQAFADDTSTQLNAIRATLESERRLASWALVASAALWVIGIGLVTAGALIA